MTFGDLDMAIGDSGTWTGTVKSAAGVAASLTGLTATFTIAQPGGSALLTKVLSQPGGTGVVQLGPLLPADTATIAAGTYPYDVVLTDVSNGRTTVETGRFTLIGHPNV